jgi:hypothetical protein
MSTLLNITVDQGSALDYIFMVQDSNGAAFNLTGCSAALMVRKTYSSASASISATTVNAKLVITSAVGGQLTWHIIPADTVPITFNAVNDDTIDCVYDLEITNGAGFIYKAARGTFTINREVTR